MRKKPASVQPVQALARTWLLLVTHAIFRDVNAETTAVDIWPKAIGMVTDKQGVVEANIELQNSGDRPVYFEAKLKLQPRSFKSRRLGSVSQDFSEVASGRSSSRKAEEVNKRGSGEAKPSSEAVLSHRSAAFARRLQNSSRTPALACNATRRLLLQLRSHADAHTSSGRQGKGGDGSVGAARRLRASQDFARRLGAAVPGLKATAWKHLVRLGMDIAELDCEAGADPEQILRAIQQDFGDELAFAELDRKSIFPAGTISADPKWNQQWAMPRLGVQAAWSRLSERLEARGQQPRPTIVAVIDTGIDLTHEDLQPVLWTNPGEIPDNGVDDDGNGYVDDVYGYDFADSDSVPQDDNTGHGTHCAGTIAASAYNGIGIAGIAGNSMAADVKVMALRFLSEDGGYNSDAVLAIEYSIEMGAIVSSNSWGGWDESVALQMAVKAAVEAGQVFIAAAGNEETNNDILAQYPCNYEDVICVASTTNYNELSSFSNWGYDSVDLAAPGSNIMSTSTLFPGYQSESGTSMAAPHVAGAVALLWSSLGDELLATPKDAGALALSAVSPIDALQGYVSTGGLLNVLKMMQDAEASAWAWLMAPAGGMADEGGVAASGAIAPGQNLTLPFKFGREGLDTGLYVAEVNISWEDMDGISGSASVPVRYELVGDVVFSSELNGTELLWTNITSGVTVSKTLSVTNFGSGLARLRVPEVSTPFIFESSGGDIEILPQQTLALTWSCRAPARGEWREDVLILTNAGLSAEEGSVSHANYDGLMYKLVLRCTSQGAPAVELQHYSGVVHLGGNSDGSDRMLQPTAASEWEKLIVDENDPRANVTAKLRALPPENRLACEDNLDKASFEGYILLVDRGTCYFQLKALSVQSAGGAGILIVDNEEPTTVKLMALPNPQAPPQIPGFLISRSMGLEYQRRLEAGEEIWLTMLRRPVVLWTNHPLWGEAPRAFGSIPMENQGEQAAFWFLDSVKLLYYQETDFYTALHEGSDATAEQHVSVPSYSWTSKSTLPDGFAAGGMYDDDAAPLQLDKPFPFYGVHQRFGKVSSNGFLSFSQGYFASSNDAYPMIPSLSEPNDIIAPYWDDLACLPSANCKISAGRTEWMAPPHHGNWLGCNKSSDAYVVQWDNAEHYSVTGGGPSASFEARLHDEGCIDFMYKAYPGDALERTSLVVGTETGVGKYGKDIAGSLSFRSDQANFAVTLVPWFAQLPSASQLLPPEGRGEVPFVVAGLKSQQGWATIVAQDISGVWRREWVTRVVQQHYKQQWYMGDWGPCIQESCDIAAAAGMQTRWVECRGNDGVAVPEANCAGVVECVDEPGGWKDTYSAGCLDYERYQYCTPDGGYGVGWDQQFWGTFEMYSNGGYIATQACCACGGGERSSKPKSQQSCAVPDLNAGCGDTPPTTTTTSTSVSSTSSTSVTTTTTSSTSTTSSTTSLTSTTSTSTSTSSSSTSSTATTTTSSSSATTSTSVTSTTITTVTSTTTTTTATSTTSSSSSTSTTSSSTTSTSTTTTSTSTSTTTTTHTTSSTSTTSSSSSSETTSTTSTTTTTSGTTSTTSATTTTSTATSTSTSSTSSTATTTTTSASTSSTSSVSTATTSITKTTATTTTSTTASTSTSSSTTSTSQTTSTTTSDSRSTTTSSSTTATTATTTTTSITTISTSTTTSSDTTSTSMTTATTTSTTSTATLKKVERLMLVQASFVVVVGGRAEFTAGTPESLKHALALVLGVEDEQVLMTRLEPTVVAMQGGSVPQGRRSRQQGSLSGNVESPPSQGAARGRRLQTSEMTAASGPLALGVDFAVRIPEVTEQDPSAGLDPLQEQSRHVLVRVQTMKTRPSWLKERLVEVLLQEQSETQSEASSAANPLLPLLSVRSTMPALSQIEPKLVQGDWSACEPEEPGSCQAVRRREVFCADNSTAAEPRIDLGLCDAEPTPVAIETCAADPGCQPLDDRGVQDGLTTTTPAHATEEPGSGDDKSWRTSSRTIHAADSGSDNTLIVATSIGALLVVLLGLSMLATCLCRGSASGQWHLVVPSLLRRRRNRSIVASLHVPADEAPGAGCSESEDAGGLVGGLATPTPARQQTQQAPTQEAATQPSPLPRHASPCTSRLLQPCSAQPDAWPLPSAGQPPGPVPAVLSPVDSARSSRSANPQAVSPSSGSSPASLPPPSPSAEGFRSGPEASVRMPPRRPPPAGQALAAKVAPKQQDGKNPPPPPPPSKRREVHLAPPGAPGGGGYDDDAAAAAAATVASGGSSSVALAAVSQGIATPRLGVSPRVEASPPLQ
eukprot:TRINITY_DN50550_c0_g1_i1.p1 TRINITY_DN50550_c0_g1~~TRINITY_DN50550_c0_g1_i1.p1  ORF type:complete len:2280 (-),score=471.98 TRINITY_DN50550_c0_g1_i1:91-6930(-)